MIVPGWRLRRGVPLLSHTWGDETVIFDPESGDTHLLNTASFGIVERLSSDPETIEQLASRVATSLDLPLDEQLRTYIEELLLDLAEIGLVEPVRLEAQHEGEGPVRERGFPPA